MKATPGADTAPWPLHRPLHHGHRTTALAQKSLRQTGYGSVAVPAAVAVAAAVAARVAALACVPPGLSGAASPEDGPQGLEPGRTCHRVYLEPPHRKTAREGWGLGARATWLLSSHLVTGRLPVAGSCHGACRMAEALEKTCTGAPSSVWARRAAKARKRDIGAAPAHAAPGGSPPCCIVEPPVVQLPRSSYALPETGTLDRRDF